MKGRGRIAAGAAGLACAALIVGAGPAAQGKPNSPKPKTLTFKVVTSQGLTGTLTYHPNHPTAGKRAILASIPVRVTCVTRTNVPPPPTTTTTTEQIAFGIAGTIGKKANGASVTAGETDPINPLNYDKRTLQVTLAPKRKKGKPPAWKRASGSFTIEVGTGSRSTPSLANTKVCSTPAPVTFGPA